MKLSRRAFITGTAGTAAGMWALTRSAGAQPEVLKIRISACDWSLGAGGPEGLQTAQAVGLDGLEISAGGPADTLTVADPAVRAQYKEFMQKTGLAVSSIAMGLLNGNPLATDPRAAAWLEQTIAAAKDLRAGVILVAFFGKGDLRSEGKLKEGDLDVVVERLRAAAPKAQEAGVILGIENTLSAEQNVAILDRVQSPAVRVYYDVGNSTHNDYNVPTEIRALGDKMCQIHFKDGEHYLGEGDVKMDPVAEALRAIKYKGWVVLETSIPSKDRDADFKRNIEFTRRLLGLRAA